MSVTDYLKAEHMVCSSKVVHHKQQLSKLKKDDEGSFSKAAEHYMQIEFYKGRKSMIIQMLDMIEKKQLTEFK